MKAAAPSAAPLVLAVFLVLWGILSATFIQFNFDHSRDVLAVLAIVAGVLLLLRR